MKKQLLALAAALSVLGAGTIVFINWDTGQQSALPPGVFEFIDRSSCTEAACGAQLCLAGNNVMVDAGNACTTRFMTCDVRVGQHALDWAADAGLALSPKRYQRLRFVGLRCVGADGGFVRGVPMDDDGTPQFAALTPAAPLCVRAPLDGGSDCQRDEGDGGSRFYGTGNVFSSSLAVGAQCEPVVCTVVFGDSDSDL